jgi:Protein of unknown function, DUF547
MRFQRLATHLTVALFLASGMPTKGVAAPLETKFAVSNAQSTTAIDHGRWTELLAKYVVAGADGINRVRYGDFKRDGHAALKSYVKTLEGVDVATLARPELFAFWANLYNAKTIDVVLDAYPIKSIKDIRLGGGLVATVTGGPWKAKVVTVAGEALSLDDIEHGILRKVFKDPRVHYAVNCASIGCPNLMREAFTGVALDQQLNAGARAYVNHPRGFQVGKDGVTASSIYNWFVADFGGDDAGVLAHARRYSDPALTKALAPANEISDYGYDWSLNDAVQ